MVAKNTVTSCGLHVLGYEPVMSPPLLHRRVNDVVVGYCSAVSKSRRTGEQSNRLGRLPVANRASARPPLAVAVR
jgi:hypothetical protein